MSGPSRLSAEEAAERLGVRRETLYAYVSRGLIRSESQEGSRERRYHAEDVQQLVRRRQGRRDPAAAAQEALHWGTPLLESELTCIADGALYFRGQAAISLSASSTFEAVAGLLWGASPESEDEPPPALPALAKAASALPPIERFQVVLAAVAAHDLRAYDRSIDTVRRCGLGILRLLAATAVGKRPSRAPIASVLQRGWAPERPEASALIESALVLWADHELNVGTFTVRCVASAHATPYGAVIAGLSALRGTLHGGLSEQVEALFDEISRPERARTVLQARLRRGELIPGFGHSLYPDGDPRAATVLARLSEELPRDDATLALADAIADHAHALIGRRPNVDFSTVTLRRALALPPDTALALTAVARSAGWIAHVIEQYAANRLIRPRARYTGPPTPRG